MALSDHKISDAGIEANGVQSQADKLTGTAQENKLVFDKLITDVVKGCLNGLIDAIMGSGGAAGVGIDTIGGLSGVTTVQGALAKIEEQMQDITQGAVADGSITTVKLADLAVTAAKLAAGCIVAAKLSDGAVETAKLSDLAVTAAKLAADAVETAKLKDGAVTTEKLADDSVTNAKIGPGAVGTTELDDLSVSTAKLIAGAVTAAKLGNGAVTAAKLGDDVTPAAIGAAGLDTDGLALAGQTISRWKIVSEAAAFPYTPTADDNGFLIRLAIPSAVEAANRKVILPAILAPGTELEFYQYGSRAPIFEAGSGASILVLNDALTMAGNGACVAAKKITSSSWLLSGALV